ncbi:DMT family transporter [Xylanibacter oryzae]|uniref:DMT family transporter n=1 Tax=Xylanibacter oryzae TaxID=185293 RepID=UPI0004B4D917|nr:DMT family transporter [Xylanibacter oryzae]MBP7358483.1 DMT family transporter [Prevotella sp.]
MIKNKELLYHLVALFTVSVWGTTYVASKVLITNGLSPAQIFTLRFIIAYSLMLAMFHKKLLADNIRDELLFAALGITGGSMYFLTENTALGVSTATNVSLIVCSCPLVASILISIIYKSEHFKRMQILGSLIALAGMATVVLNGHFVLHLSPIGDALAFGACLCWAFYSVLMKKVSNRYSSAFITRKTFFYGLVTILPYYIVKPDFPSLQLLMRQDVLANLLFLGCVASMLCYLLWTWCINKLGVVKASNWIYFNPITTIIFAWIVLGEEITVYFISGAALILVGMYIADRKA